MGNPSKTLTAISTCVKPYTFDRGAGSLELQIDLDAFTDQYFTEVGVRQRERVKTQLPALVTAMDNNSAPQELANADVIDEAAIAAEMENAPQPEPEATGVKTALDTIERIWKEAAQQVNEHKELRIDMLLAGEEPHKGSVLRGWDAENDDGSPLPLNAEILRKLSQRALEELWEFCAENVRTVKKTSTAAATR